MKAKEIKETVTKRGHLWDADPELKKVLALMASKLVELEDKVDSMGEQNESKEI